MGGVLSLPVAIDRIAVPLGSPTIRPPPGFTSDRNLESDMRKKVSVAPVSCIGNFALLLMLCIAVCELDLLGGLRRSLDIF